MLHRFVISQMSDAGIDRDRLLRECELPEWTLAGEGVHVPSRIFSRLWEVGEKWLDDPDVALHVASRYQLAATRLYDYLFASAPTVGAGLATCGPYVSAVTTNHRFDLVPETASETTLYLEMIEGDGRGRELVQLWGLVAVLTRSRRVLTTPLDPIRVTLRQSAPQRLDVFQEVFGTADLVFDADTDSMVFRSADMERPLITADPVLADVLQPLAAALPPPPPLVSAWPERVSKALAEAFSEGEVSLDQVARRLVISPRTLQRRLAESGTTWRQELDRARLARAAAAGPVSRERQAELLGYADAGSMRRAARRWSMVAHSRSAGPAGCQA
ncbi:AraC family transcriptional regulator ligand-binding domain-containing protein [Nocardia sp. NPDC052254]|uniref:AraC family transcriptional regulator ligand-binding domain-containing protein n=1 Tax=Nocardia sp. NPDC052254 TaxID=3155681 RepID=UPI0034216872